MADAQDSRSLIIGRILQVDSDGRVVPHSELHVGELVFLANADGMYEIPLDGMPLPLDLTISAPGFFQRNERLDWTPILPGGLLVRDFYLLENPLEALPTGSEPEEGHAVQEQLVSLATQEGAGLPLEFRQELARWDTSSLLFRRSGSAEGPLGNLREPQGGRAVPQLIIPDEALAATDGTYIPPESLRSQGEALSRAMDALLNRLDESEELILVSGGLEPGMSELSEAVYDQNMDEAEDLEGADDELVYARGGLEDASPGPDSVVRSQPYAGGVSYVSGASSRPGRPGGQPSGNTLWDDLTPGAPARTGTDGPGEPTSATAHDSESLERHTRADNTWEFFRTSGPGGDRIEPALGRLPLPGEPGASPSSDPMHQSPVAGQPARPTVEEDDFSWATSEWEEDQDAALYDAELER